MPEPCNPSTDDKAVNGGVGSLRLENPPGTPIRGRVDTNPRLRTIALLPPHRLKMLSARCVSYQFRAQRNVRVGSPNVAANTSVGRYVWSYAHSSDSAWNVYGSRHATQCSDGSDRS